MFLVAGNVLGRFIGSSLLVGVPNIVGYLLAIGGVGSGAFIRLELIDRWLRPRGERGLEIVNLVLAAFYIGYLTYTIAIMTLRSYVQGTTSSGLWTIPDYLPQGLLVVLLGFTGMYVIYRAAALLRRRNGN
jgi:TRAP-type C4-dicarboxylate transport system permease small subunit